MRQEREASLFCCCLGLVLPKSRAPTAYGDQMESIEQIIHAVHSSSGLERKENEQMNRFYVQIFYFILTL